MPDRVIGKQDHKPDHKQGHKQGHNQKPERWPANAKSVWRWFLHFKWQIILLLIAILTVVLGVIGFAKLPAEISGADTFNDYLYLALQLLVLNSGAVHGDINPQLELARFLGAFFAVYAILQILSFIFSRQLQVFWISLRYRNHVIICGLGRIGSLLAQGLIEQGKRVVVIENNIENGHINQLQELGAIVLMGDATDSNMLGKAGLKKADVIIAVGGGDGVNSLIAEQAYHLVDKEKRRGALEPRRVVKCYAHILNTHLCHYLTGRALTTWTADNFQLELINIMDIGARTILEKYPLVHEGVSADEPPHLLVIGLTPVGLSLVARAGRSWLPVFEQTGKTLPITIIDQDAKAHLDLLSMEFPYLENIFSINTTCVDTSTPAFLKNWPPIATKELDQISRIFVCLDNDANGLTVALMLLQRVRNRNLPIIVFLTTYGELEGLLSERKDGISDKIICESLPDSLECAADDTASGFETLIPVNLLEFACTPSILEQGLFEDLAIAIHEQYCDRAKNRGEDLYQPKYYSWFSQEKGRDLDTASKNRNRGQARYIGKMLWQVGYGIEPLNQVKEAIFFLGETEDEIFARRGLLEKLAVKSAREEISAKAYFARLVKASGSPSRYREESELEYISRLEHERWLVGKFGENIIDNLAGNLYHWFDPRLEDGNRMKTREMVCGWPGLLARAGLRVYDRRNPKKLNGVDITVCRGEKHVNA
jgi:hypothetical protein